jgi:DNA-directed RNA polymerase beta subunit
LTDEAEYHVLDIPTDGGTGERFHQAATVGVIYMLKLGHMVDDKMHTFNRTILINTTTFGGKAQFGGQRRWRFGHLRLMEHQVH